VEKRSENPSTWSFPSFSMSPCLIHFSFDTFCLKYFSFSIIMWYTRPINLSLRGNFDLLSIISRFKSMLAGYNLILIKPLAAHLVQWCVTSFERDDESQFKKSRQWPKNKPISYKESLSRIFHELAIEKNTRKSALFSLSVCGLTLKN